MGRSTEGIDYESMDGEPSHLFFMIAAPAGADNTHIETLARLTQLLLDDDFRISLEKAETPDEVLDIINKKEAEKLKAENAEKEEFKEYLKQNWKNKEEKLWEKMKN